MRSQVNADESVQFGRLEVGIKVRGGSMKAWQVDRLGGQSRLNDIAVPAVLPGRVLVRVEAQSLMSYLKDYVEGKLPASGRQKAIYPGPETQSA
jgi:hypothetical protein